MLALYSAGRHKCPKLVCIEVSALKHWMFQLLMKSGTLLAELLMRNLTKLCVSDAPPTYSVIMTFCAIMQLVLAW